MISVVRTITFHYLFEVDKNITVVDKISVGCERLIDYEITVFHVIIFDNSC